MTSHRLGRASFRLSAFATCAMIASSPDANGQTPVIPPSPSARLLEQAPASAWRTISPDNLLVLRLSDGRHIAIELAAAFAPIHVENIRKLARKHTLDGMRVMRVQDNYVVQWSPPPGTPRPEGFVSHPPAEYDLSGDRRAMRRLPFRDAYAERIGYVDSWPVASDGKSRWLTHCYGMVGAGRGMPPLTGDAAELYAVLGQSMRMLDRNMALVGRIIQGMEILAAQPRAPGSGYYADPQQGLQFAEARIASDLPTTTRPSYQVLDTAAPEFMRWLSSRTQSSPYKVYNAGTTELCALQVPVREVPTSVNARE